MLMQAKQESASTVELTACDREPIRVPGSIQSRGFLLILNPVSRAISHASENVQTYIGRPADQLVGKSLGDVLRAGIGQELIAELQHVPDRSYPTLIKTCSIANSPNALAFDVIAHQSEAGYVVEFEAIDTPPRTNRHAAESRKIFDEFAGLAEQATNVGELSSQAAIAVRKLTGFDRVLIYQFDDVWNGIVVGEDGNGKLPSLIHHRFPATDIPAQARDLYRLNRVRIIADSNYQPSPIYPQLDPATDRPLDLTFSVLRSVSPVHVEYMQNMKTASSMSISILRNGNLWGLISCHHRAPKNVSFSRRAECDLFARAFSLRMSGLEFAQEYERRIEVRSIYSRLLAVMADRGDYAEALSENLPDVLAFTASRGAAVLSENECVLLGETPSEKEVRAIAKWLFEDVKQEVFSTDWLTSVYPDSIAFQQRASGILAVSISKLHRSYLMWFRPEVIQTIPWAGQPEKIIDPQDGPARLHPRRSFETWKETVRERSLPWKLSEIEGATELRNAIVGIVLRKAEELAELNAELRRSNRELEAFSYSVSHDLRSPLRHIVGYAEMLKEYGAGKLSPKEERYISVIIESSEYAGKLVDKLLSYSRLGRAELQRSEVDMNELVQEIKRDVMLDAAGRRVEWQVENLPPANADLMMLRMAVRDLMANAVKYSRSRDVAQIEVGGRRDETETVWWVKDNGVGFDMQYADKLFGVFQRLHRWEDYEGTGIGLANVQRVIERHGGRTWAYGQEGVGATFFFSIPHSSGGVKDHHD